MIESFVFSEGKLVSHNLEWEALRLARADKGLILWIDLTAPTEEETKQVLEQLFEFHPLAIEDCVTRSELSKVEDYEDYLFLIVQSASAGTEKSVQIHELNMFLGKEFLVTFHQDAIPALTLLKERVAKGVAAQARSADRLAHQVLDLAADSYLPVVDLMTQEMEDVEEKSLAGERKEDLSFWPVIRDGDVLFFFNFRADRMRQIVRSLADPAFNSFPIARRPKTQIFTLTPYEADFTNLGIRHLFSPVEMNDLLGEVVAARGLKQARMAETEKYPHVTYFFNGGKENPNPGEERIMTPSPKVATYDLQPEMSAIPLTDKVVERIEKGLDDLIILNFANPDMVGHTGVLTAAIQAVETIDACVGRVLETLLKKGGKALVTADHGNCEQMLQSDGSPHTAHTTNLVHCLYVATDSGQFKVADGILADVAPTLLEMLGLPKPSAMTGSSLLRKK